MFWVCLRFPCLALDALQDIAPPHRARACAVVEGPAQRRRIVLANAAAQACGVRAGQALALAHALCPALHVLARDAGAERQSLETFAALAYRYSADVHLRAPDAVLFEAGASLKLFGGWPALQRRLRGELSRSGFSCHVAAAPTASAAHVLAASSSGIALAALPALHDALAALPIAHGGLDARAADALLGMGLRTLGDLFRLPRPELARRIGPAALVHLDRLRGLVAESAPRWQPSARFERRLDFEANVDSTAALAFPLQRLIREFALFLVARDGGVQRFSLQLGHERGACTRIEVGLLAPQRDAASLFELARVRLDRVALAAPVQSLALCADDLPPLAPAHRELFDERKQGGLDWPALAERLRSRLGDAALHGLACAADHRPARAWRFTAPPESQPSPSPGKTPQVRGRSAGQRQAQALGDSNAPDSGACRDEAGRWQGDGAARPFWLLRRPLALREAPQRILAGPERIESGWWDGHDQRRDYYVVELRSGQRAWAFVEAGTNQNWTLHGWFA